MKRRVIDRIARRFFFSFIGIFDKKFGIFSKYINDSIPVSHYNDLYVKKTNMKNHYRMIQDI